MVAQRFSLVGHLVASLERCVRLSEEDRRALEQFRGAPVREAPARHDLASEAQEPAVVRLLLEGWACRYKDLPDGRRQIVGFLVPGDFCDLNVHVLHRMDHSIGAITPVRYFAIPSDRLHALTENHPRVAQALLWHELVTSSIQREWLLNIGQRSAIERVAHLLVELYLRLRAAGVTADETCGFPLTQIDLADATGLTPVHINRTLQQLRRERLIALSHRELTILDVARLKQLAMFDASYLQLDSCD